MTSHPRSVFPLLALLTFLAAVEQVAAAADPAPFDLAGPTLEVKVTRGAKTLPIAQVPNLAPGDRVWIKADLPASQSAHYLMVTAFLRGATNPPPADWFYRCETWAGKCAQAGLSVTVPKDAQQVLLFLAPDFRTLVDAVRGRPGAFVRTSQDLNQATLDRSRLEGYLAAIHRLNDADPDRLKDATPLLARSLAIKVNDKCLDRLPELQAPCLMQGQGMLILNDGHSTSIVEALTSGPVRDLAMEASYTPQLSYGYYSPYVASVLDIAHIFDSFRTARYQYIPALASQQTDKFALTLNTPPSFHDPQSVLVATLPAVEQVQLPPLHAVNPKDIYCARKDLLTLPVEGAPLVFSTAYAHDLALSLTGKDGRTLELPATADAEAGGFTIDTAALTTTQLGDSVRGALHGYWGFDKYEGPNFQLVNAHAQIWELAGNDAAAPIVGRDSTVHLRAASVSCLDSVMLASPDGKELKAEWKAVGPDKVEVKLALTGAAPGSMTLLIKQYGASAPQPIPLHTFSEAGHLDSFTLHAGDAQGTLRGSRLDQVAGLLVKDIELIPGKLTTRQGSDQLTVTARDAQATGALKQGEAINLKVTLKDGRALYLDTLVDAPRPSVKLIGKSVQYLPSSNDSNVQLVDPNQLPQDARLTFSVRAQSPAAFAYDEKLEVATADESLTTTLSLDNGGLTLESKEVVVATLDPAKGFGPSAFGPLQFRTVANGVSGDWLPLATLVRLPTLKDLQCPATPDLACKLTGANLFLLDSVSGEPNFEHSMQVPDGFPGYALPVPHPTDGQLYVKLRDDPSVINLAELAAKQLAPSPTDAVRASARHAAVNKEVAKEAAKVPDAEPPPP